MIEDAVRVCKESLSERFSPNGGPGVSVSSVQRLNPLTHVGTQSLRVNMHVVLDDASLHDPAALRTVFHQVESQVQRAVEGSKVKLQGSVVSWAHVSSFYPKLRNPNKNPLATISATISHLNSPVITDREYGKALGHITVHSI